MSENPEFLPTRQSLLSRLRDWNDQDSWKDFFDTYWKLIYASGRRAGLTDAEAQDLVQETVLSVAKRLPKFRYDPEKGSFKTWLMRLTSWRIMGQLRKRQPQVAVGMDPMAAGGEPEPDLIEELPDPKGSALEKVWNEEWEKHLVDSAIHRVKQSVNAKQYQMFDLCVAKKMSVSQVARAMNVGIGQVYLAKYRVGRMIRKEVARLQEQNRC